MPLETEIMAEVGRAIAAISGYGEFHVDAISRELGWNVERNRTRVAQLVRSMIKLGYVDARAEDRARGVAPPRVLGLSAAGRQWLRSRSPT
ncbi:MAG: hypothetical protein ABR564_06130 [Candidatus Dormibacteria bacterium]